MTVLFSLIVHHFQSGCNFFKKCEILFVCIFRTHKILAIKLALARQRSQPFYFNAVNQKNII